jgi:DDE superfamily endonuclease
MFRIIRVPPTLDKFFQPLKGHFHWDHFAYFRLLVLPIALMWGRRNVANLYRYLDAEHHRTRVNNFFLVERWDPEAALRQQAQELLRSLRPKKGETIYLVLDDSQKAKRGRTIDAIAKMKASTTNTDIRGHQYVCAILVCRDHVIPVGIRLYVTQAYCPALGLSFRKTTELAAQLIREFKASTGVKVVVLFDAYSLCATVVKACREQRFHFASTLKSNRSLFKLGWKLKAGRYGRNLFRRRRTDTLDLSKPYGPVHYCFVDVGWLQVSTLNRSYWAAVTHLHLVCFAYALLTHLRIERHGAQGRRTRATAADLSTATAQDQLRGLLWGDLIIYLKEKRHSPSVIEELERLRVA